MVFARCKLNQKLMEVAPPVSFAGKLLELNALNQIWVVGFKDVSYLYSYPMVN